MESYLIVDDDTGVVLKIEKGSVLSSYGLPLSDDHRWHYLLTKLGLALLDGSEHHVATGCGRKSVQPTTDTTDSDDVKILGAGIVSTVDDCADWQTKGNSELSSG